MRELLAMVSMISLLLLIVGLCALLLIRHVQAVAMQ